MVFTYSKARAMLALPQRSRRAIRYRKRRINIGSRVKRLESNIEYKFLDTPSTELSPTVAGVVTLVNGLAQGADTNQRDGDQVNFTSIQFKFLAGASAEALKNNIRFMLVQDRQPNGNALSISEVLQEDNGQDRIVSPLNLANKFRFRVLCDEQIQINGGGLAFNVVSKYMKLGVKTRYNGALGVIANINTNSIYSIVIGYAATGVYNYNIRLRFTDS